MCHQHRYGRGDCKRDRSLQKTRTIKLLALGGILSAHHGGRRGVGRDIRCTVLDLRRWAFPRRCSLWLPSGYAGQVGVRWFMLALSLICAFTPVNSPGGAIVPGPKKATAHSPDWTTKCIAHGAFDSKCIAFTFDDGPNPDTTPDILRVLAKYNAKGTFFLIGWRVRKYPDLVKRINQEGHEIGNHSYSHPDLRKLSKDNVYREYADCSAAIKELTNHAPILCRPPGGDANRQVVNVAGSLGMRSVAWSMNVHAFAEPVA